MKVERLIDTKDIMVAKKAMLILKNNYVPTHDAKGLHEKKTVTWPEEHKCAV